MKTLNGLLVAATLLLPGWDHLLFLLMLLRRAAAGSRSPRSSPPSRWPTASPSRSPRSTSWRCRTGSWRRSSPCRSPPSRPRTSSSGRSCRGAGSSASASGSSTASRRPWRARSSPPGPPVLALRLQHGGRAWTGPGGRAHIAGARAAPEHELGAARSGQASSAPALGNPVGSPLSHVVPGRFPPESHVLEMRERILRLSLVRSRSDHAHLESEASRFR